MPIDIRMTGPEADQELTSFYAWLRDEPDIRNHAHITINPATPGPGKLGAAFDVIQLVVDSGFQALNFALAFAAWRSTRQSHSQITIECDGTSVTLDGDESDTSAIIVRTLS